MTNHIPDAGKKLVEAVAQCISNSIAAQLKAVQLPGGSWSASGGALNLTVVSSNILAAIDAAGWQIVPKTATVQMSDAGKHYMKGSEGEVTERTRAEDCYKIMLAAAPKVVP